MFAATNSQTRYGIGLILASFAKKRIKGVNVIITMSFEANIVRIAHKPYSKKNKARISSGFIASSLIKLEKQSLIGNKPVINKINKSRKEGK